MDTGFKRGGFMNHMAILQGCGKRMCPTPIFSWNLKLVFTMLKCIIYKATKLLLSCGSYVLLDIEGVCHAIFGPL